MVLASASRVPQIKAASRYLVRVDRAELERRAAYFVGRVMVAGGRAYIGSTSDPQWRWQGGWYVPSTGGGKNYMPGHRKRWSAMIVLGSWPDRETAQMEEAAILAGEAAAKPRTLENKCSDARGLSIRSHAFSFVYICFDVFG